MISLENAQGILNKVLSRLSLHTNKIEFIPLWEAGGRVLAEDIVAQENVPAFNRSPIDGFALRCSDTYTATREQPVTLKIIDTVAAGSYSLKEVTPGTAAKIFTGAPLPEGADCLIKMEEVSSDGEKVIISRALSKGENVAFKGEDISVGEFMFGRGTVITPAQMGILATLGIDPVPVYERPKIGVFSTGNELVEVQCQLKHGQLRASNIFTLAEIIRQAGGIPVNLGVVKDNIDDVLKVYDRAQELKLPLVVSTGGTASGDYDVIKQAMDMTSSTRLFNKVAIRPGAPVVVSVKEKQLLIGLSGNPAGATVAMLIVVLPIISKLAGTDWQLKRSQGKLVAPISRKVGLRGFLWGNYYEEGGCLYVKPSSNQFCGAVKSYAFSNCLIEVPAGEVSFEPGEMVEFWVLYF